MHLPRARESRPKVAGPGAGFFPVSGLGIVFRLASMPVSWSNFGISAGSHPEREFTGQPPMARESDSSSTSPVLFRLGNSNTRLWVGRTQQPQLCSRCPAFRTCYVSRAGCASGSDSSFCLALVVYRFSERRRGRMSSVRFELSFGWCFLPHDEVLRLCPGSLALPAGLCRRAGLAPLLFALSLI